MKLELPLKGHALDVYPRHNWFKTTHRPLLKLEFFISVLSLFTVVAWGQGQCMAPSGEYGSCVPNNECLPRGGIPGGPCAEGYGMCCVCMLLRIFYAQNHYD